MVLPTLAWRRSDACFVASNFGYFSLEQCERSARTDTVVRRALCVFVLTYLTLKKTALAERLDQS